MRQLLATLRQRISWIFRPGYNIGLITNARLDHLTKMLTTTTMDNRGWLGGEMDRIREAVLAIHPAHIDMTQELADAILDRMRGPLTIPQAVSDWLRGYTPMQYTMPVGNGGYFRYQVMADGTMELHLYDTAGVRAWVGTLVPPDYRKGN